MKIFLSKGISADVGSPIVPQRERGTPVELHPDWFEMLQLKRAQLPKSERSYEALGEALARQVGRASAWGKTQVGNYMTGQVVTAEMTRAFSLLFGIGYPVLAAANEDEIAWFYLGRKLRILNNSRFREILRDEGEWVILEERRLKRKRQLEQAAGKRRKHGDREGES